MYSAKIKESTIKMSPKQAIAFKDVSNAVKLDSEVDSEGSSYIIPKVKGYVVLDIHNDKSERPDYENYVIVDENDGKYVTGSPSFWQNFMDIYNEMAAYPDEEWGIEVYKLPSKNYRDKFFLTCSIY